MLGTLVGWAVSTSNPPFPCRKWRPSPKYRHSSGGRAAMSEQTFGWQTLCEAAIIETNPDKAGNLHRGGRAGHRSTRITCGYYRTRASQVEGCPFNAQEFDQNCFVARETCRIRRSITPWTTTIRLRTFLPLTEKAAHHRAAFLFLMVSVTLLNRAREKRSLTRTCEGPFEVN